MTAAWIQQQITFIYSLRISFICGHCFISFHQTTIPSMFWRKELELVWFQEMNEAIDAANWNVTMLAGLLLLNQIKSINCRFSLMIELIKLKTFSLLMKSTKQTTGINDWFDAASQQLQTEPPKPAINFIHFNSTATSQSRFGAKIGLVELKNEIGWFGSVWSSKQVK